MVLQRLKSAAVITADFLVAAVSGADVYSACVEAACFPYMKQAVSCFVGIYLQTPLGSSTSGYVFGLDGDPQ